MGIAILLVDDHALVREGLKTLLSAEEDLHVVGEASTASEALAFTRHLRPDVVVLDVRLPDRDGIAICPEIRELSPATRILVCSGLIDGSALAQAAMPSSDADFYGAVTAEPILIVLDLAQLDELNDIAEITVRTRP